MSERIPSAIGYLRFCILTESRESRSGSQQNECRGSQSGRDQNEIIISEKNKNKIKYSYASYAAQQSSTHSNYGGNLGQRGVTTNTEEKIRCLLTSHVCGTPEYALGTSRTCDPPCMRQFIRGSEEVKPFHIRE